MIGYLSGKVKFLFDESCILDVHDVSYKVFVDAQTMQKVTLNTAVALAIAVATGYEATSLAHRNSLES